MPQWLFRLGVQLLVLAHVMISWSWDQAPHWALHWAWSLLWILSLFLSLLLPYLHACTRSLSLLKYLFYKYCKNVNTTQSYLHIQCNPNQNRTSILLETRTSNPKICMEPQKPRIAKVILKKKTKAGGITIPDCSLYYKAVIFVWPTHLSQSRKEHPMEKRQSL